MVILALVAFSILKLTNVWFGVSGAQAQEEFTNLAQSPETGPVTTSGSEENKDAPAPNLPASEVERRILEKLAARREALDLREEELKAREAVLTAAEKQINDRIAFFNRERASLTVLREEKEQTETKEMDALVSAYERMKPKDAAAIFNELDEDILAPVAAGMRTQALSGVLANMTPEKARKLTTLLADRHKVDQTAPAPAQSNAQ